MCQHFLKTHFNKITNYLSEFLHQFRDTKPSSLNIEKKSNKEIKM